MGTQRAKENVGCIKRRKNGLEGTFTGIAWTSLWQVSFLKVVKLLLVAFIKRLHIYGRAIFDSKPLQSWITPESTRYGCQPLTPLKLEAF
jgi:hypothetical protein